MEYKVFHKKNSAIFAHCFFCTHNLIHWFFYSLTQLGVDKGNWGEFVIFLMLLLLWKFWYLQPFYPDYETNFQKGLMSKLFWQRSLWKYGGVPFYQFQFLFPFFLIAGNYYFYKRCLLRRFVKKEKTATQGDVSCPTSRPHVRDPEPEVYLLV